MQGAGTEQGHHRGGDRGVEGRVGDDLVVQQVAGAVDGDPVLVAVQLPPAGCGDGVEVRGDTGLAGVDGDMPMPLVSQPALTSPSIRCGEIRSGRAGHRDGGAGDAGGQLDTHPPVIDADGATLGEGGDEQPGVIGCPQFGLVGVGGQVGGHGRGGNEVAEDGEHVQPFVAEHPVGAIDEPAAADVAGAVFGESDRDGLTRMIRLVVIHELPQHGQRSGVSVLVDRDDAGVAMAGQQRGHGGDLVALAGGFLQQHPGLRVSEEDRPQHGKATP